MSVSFSISKSEPIDVIDDGDEWETLTKCLMSTMPQILNSVVQALIAQWTMVYPEDAEDDEGFEFSVSRVGLLTRARFTNERYTHDTSLETMMAPLVDAGYISFVSRVRNGKSLVKGASRWANTYKAVPMMDALEIAREEFNKQIAEVGDRIDFVEGKKWRKNNVSVAIISDPRAGKQKSKVKKRLEAMSEGKDKFLVINFMTKATSKPAIGTYYDAVLVVGESKGAKQVFAARQEASKRKRWASLERTFDNVDECVEFLEGQLTKKRRKKKASPEKK